MNDRIIEGYLKDFIESNNLGHLTEPEAFEHFINYCIVSREHPENFEFEQIAVGGTGDQAIDGIAILVNEHVVFSKEDIQFFTTSLRRLDARFIFVQSKTSPKFEAAEIGSFLFGVRSFFSKQPPATANPYLRFLCELKENIYDSSIHMDKSPICDMYYATTGKWQDDPAVAHRINADVALLKGTNLFSQVNFNPLDADAIKALYRELKRKVVKEILFEKHTILPKIKSIEEAYIGILPGSEYLKLICDEKGNLQRSLFYDNVRDFQGNNSVNRAINATLNDAKQRDKFLVLNNGVTVVAQSINKVGSTFRLKDFQIVNGCQTSHMLHQNRAAAAHVFVPVKVIVTGWGCPLG